MRISESGMVRTVLRDIMGNRDRLSGLHQQLSSGSTINRPSDDPGGTATVLQVESNLSEIEQFDANCSLAEEWLGATESVLAEATDSVNRLRELAVGGAGDSLPAESMEALGREAEEITDHLLSLANTRHAGKYIFAGHQTSLQEGERPFALDYDEEQNVQVQYSGDSGQMMRQVGPDVSLQVNIPGEEVFSDLLQTAAHIRDDLLADDSEAVAGRLQELDEKQDDLLSVRAQVGGRMNRLDMSRERLEDIKIFLRRVVSDTADTDMAEAIMQLSATERSYQVALATAARILPTTLLDYLR